MAVAALLIAGAGGLVLAGCGSEGATESSTAPVRAAEGEGWVTCPEDSSRGSSVFTIRNTTVDPIILNVGDVDCRGYSGGSNPSVFSNIQLKPGGEISRRLQYRASAKEGSAFTLYLGKTAQQKVLTKWSIGSSEKKVDVWYLQDTIDGAKTASQCTSSNPPEATSVRPGPYGDSFGLSVTCAPESRPATLTIGYAPNGTGRITTEINFLPAPGTIKPRGFGKITFPAGTAQCELTNCKRRFPTGQKVTMTAVPNPGSKFTGWGDTKCDVVSGDTCTVTITDTPQWVKASFVPAAPTPPPTPTSPTTPTTPEPPTPPTPTTTPTVPVPPAPPTPPTPTPTTTSTTSTAPSPPSPTPDPQPTPAPGPDPQPVPTPPGPAPAPDAPLAITGLSVTRQAFTAPQGTQVSYRLSQPADVTMTFTYGRGKAKGSRYVYRIRAGKTGAKAGNNRVRINGVVKGQRVKTGRWTMSVSATTTGAKATAKNRTLRVTR
jgi:Divergent InlB B-repeat domain